MPVAPVILLAYLGFISLGLPDGLLGVAWPATRAEFGVPAGAVGFVLAVSITGYMTASVAAGFLLARVGVGQLLAASTAAVGLGLAGYGAAPSFAAAVGVSLLLGLGAGAIDSGLNAYAAAQFSARHMNWMHASFGLGATLGPLVMTGVLAAGLAWRWGYGVVALAQAAMSVAFASTVRAWGRPAIAPTTVDRRRVVRLPAAWFGVLLFGLYTGVEIGAGLWAYTLLTEGRGLSGTVAGGCVSAYWGSLFVGRVLYGVVADRLPAGPVVRTCLAVIGIGAGMLAVPGTGWLAVVGLILIGGFAAPVFPLLTLTTAERVGDAHADRAIGMQMGAAGLGGTVIPAGIGVLLDRLGADVIGVSLMALAGAVLALHLTASPPVRSSRREPL